MVVACQACARKLLPPARVAEMDAAADIDRSRMS
jgi:hypothetical protein